MENIDLLRSLIVQGLFRTEITAGDCDFKSWVSSGSYVVRSNPSAKEMHMEINNEYAFCHMLTFDICRLSTAAFETMQQIHISPNLPKSYGWLAIQCYYAAFFSAHSIMRYFGYVCSHLEKGHVKLLNDYGSAVGISTQIKKESGLFSGSYNSSSREFILKKMNNSHEDTWSCLTQCLVALSQDVLCVSGLTKEKQRLSAELDDLVYNLKGRGRYHKGTYLSCFRNSINYRQSHNAWHPYGKNSLSASKILDYISKWREDTVPVINEGWKESREVYFFFSTCVDIINLCYKLVNIVLDNSTSTKTLFNRWPNKFLNLTCK